MKATRGLGAAVTAWALVAAPLPAVAADGDKPVLAARPSPSRHLRVDDTLGVLLDTPAFAGFASLLLPWDGRGYDSSLSLREIGSLMPYHSHVDPAGTVAALNRMADDATAGRPVFYDIYTEEQKRADPTKTRTGMFFFRGKPGAPFAVISPGGGFAYVGSLHEGFPYAASISADGYNAFVVRYRPGIGEKAATDDLAAAISYIFQNAEALGVNTAGYSLWGSSAGARMAANIGSHGTVAYDGGDLPGPAAVIMAYTAHADHAAKEPPTFAVVGDRDSIAPPSSMERRITVLRRIGTPVGFRVYPGLEHGFGLGTGTAAEGWIEDATRFWRLDAGDLKAQGGDQ